MKKNILFGALLFAAGTLLAADSSPKDDVTAAAKKLAATDYSWKSTMDLGPDSPFTPGPTEGKIDKDGYTWLSSAFQDNTSIGVSKGKKVVVKTESGWKTADELGNGGDGFDPSTFLVRRMQGLKTPAVELQEIIAKIGELKKDGDVLSGDLSKEGAEAMLSSGFGFGPPPGGDRPAPKDAKCSVKIWIKDGQITKYETKLSGKMDFQGEERAMQFTTTTEIKDVGKTKIELPDDVKKKLS